MKRLIDLETDEEFSELSEIISEVCNGSIVATMRQAVKKPDGTYNYIDLQQGVTDAKSILQINGEYFYITIQDIRRTDVRKIMTMWNTVLQRGTNCYMKGEANDYLLTIDVVHNDQKKSLVYIVSAIQPVFVSGESDRDLMLVFSISDIRCSKDEVSMYDIEYEEALREESGDDVYKFGIDEEYEDIDSDDADDHTNGTKFVDNSRYTDL